MPAPIVQQAAPRDDSAGIGPAGKTVLFASELGGGFGHVSRMLPIAVALHAQGLTPLFAVPNLVEVHPLLSRTPFRCIQAPRVDQSRRWKPEHPQVIASFADILGLAGLGEERVLRPMIESWRTLLALAQPCLLVCEYSPFFCLAAGDRQVVVLGNGFTLPPPHLSEFPSLSSVPPQLATTEMLHVIGTVLRDYGYTAPPSLPSIFEGTRHFVCSIAELDPYRAWRLDAPCGPPTLPEACADSPPTVDLFVYLAGESPYSSAIVDALVASGLSGLLYARNARPEWEDAVKGSALRLLREPASISAMLRQARVVVHHGGMSLAEEAVFGGRPQIVLPLYLEQYLTGKRLCEMGLATMISATSPTSKIELQLRTAAADTRASQAASRASQVLRARSPSGSAEMVARVCMDLVA